MAMVVKWLIVTFLALGPLFAVYGVGKPRQPLTAGDAARLLVFSALIIVGIVVYWRT